MAMTAAQSLEYRWKIAVAMHGVAACYAVAFTVIGAFKGLVFLLDGRSANWLIPLTCCVALAFTTYGLWHRQAWGLWLALASCMAGFIYYTVMIVLGLWGFLTDTSEFRGLGLIMAFYATPLIVGLAAWLAFIACLLRDVRKSITAAPTPPTAS